MVHGVGEHFPGYATEFSEKLAKELDLSVISKRHKDIAIRTDQLDSYLKDVFKSGLFFFLAAPFVFYRVYYKGEDIYGQTGQEEPD